MLLRKIVSLTWFEDKFVGVLTFDLYFICDDGGETEELKLEVKLFGHVFEVRESSFVAQELKSQS